MNLNDKSICIWLLIGASLPLLPGTAILGIAASPWFWWSLAASLHFTRQRIRRVRNRVGKRALRRRHRAQALRLAA